MGWFVTCSLCGKMEKYGIGCDCYYKEYLANLAKMKGAVVVDIVPLRYESAVLYKLEKLCPVPEVSCLRQTKTFCLWMNLCAGGEYNSYRQLYEISEMDFEENKKGEEEAEKEEKEEELKKEAEKEEEPKKEEEEEGRPLRVLEEGDVLEEDVEKDAKKDTMRGSLSQGDVFSNCKVVDENDLYVFLIDQDVTSSYYDIVMPKTDDNSYLKKGDTVAVKVTGVNIADDGTPGAFVELVKNP